MFRLTAQVPIYNSHSPFDGPPDAFAGSALGTVLHRTLNCMKVLYNFAVNGGATGNTPLSDDLGNAAVVPPSSVILESFSNWTTPATSGGAATGAFSVASAGAADLLGATAKTSLTGVLAGTPVFTAATFIALGATATGYPINITIATAALTAGVANLYVFFVY